MFPTAACAPDRAARLPGQSLRVAITRSPTDQPLTPEPSASTVPTRW